MTEPASRFRPYPLPLWNWTIVAAPVLITIAVILLKPPPYWLERLGLSAMVAYYLYWFSTSLHRKIIRRYYSLTLDFYREVAWNDRPVLYVMGMIVIGIMTVFLTGVWAWLLFWL